MTTQASDIDKLEAEPDLDMLVAEHVMGWKWYHLRAMGGNWINILKFGEVDADYLPGKTHAKYQSPYDDPRYSTDIAAAFLVIDRLLALGFEIDIYNHDGWGMNWNVLIDREIIGSAKTIPLAICHAALTAVGEGE